VRGEDRFRDERFAQLRVGVHHLCFRARERADVDASTSSWSASGRRSSPTRGGRVGTATTRCCSRIGRDPPRDEPRCPGGDSSPTGRPDGWRRRGRAGVFRITHGAPDHGALRPPRAALDRSGSSGSCAREPRRSGRSRAAATACRRAS
jgi:hypothetical protein